MDIKKSKITKVEMLREFTSSHGTVLYPHRVTFENGDIATANKVKQNAFKEGQEIQYELEEDARGNKKFKEYKEAAYSGGGKKGSNASFALSYAKDLYVKDMEKINHGMSEEVAKKIMICAGMFNKWLNEN